MELHEWEESIQECMHTICGAEIVAPWPIGLVHTMSGGNKVGREIDTTEVNLDMHQMDE